MADAVCVFGSIREVVQLPGIFLQVVELVEVEAVEDEFPLVFPVETLSESKTGAEVFGVALTMVLCGLGRIAKQVGERAGIECVEGFQTCEFKDGGAEIVESDTGIRDLRPARCPVPRRRLGQRKFLRKLRSCGLPDRGCRRSGRDPT